MKGLLLKWVVLAVSIVGASLICQAVGLGFSADFSSAPAIVTLLLGAAALAMLNATLGRILRLLTLPLSCITLGLFSLVVNAVVLWVAASLNLGFRVDDRGFRGFVAAFVASLLISFINGLLNVLLPGDDRD